MRKIKTARGTEKRFKKTASGGCKRKQASLCHILTKKNLLSIRVTFARNLSFLKKIWVYSCVACQTRKRHFNWFE